MNRDFAESRGWSFKDDGAFFVASGRGSRFAFDNENAAISKANYAELGFGACQD